MWVTALRVPRRSARAGAHEAGERWSKAQQYLWPPRLWYPAGTSTSVTGWLPANTPPARTFRYDVVSSPCATATALTVWAGSSGPPMSGVVRAETIAAAAKATHAKPHRVTLVTRGHVPH